MDASAIEIIRTGQDSILAEVQRIEVLLLISMFLSVLMIGIVFILAAWSVQKVMNRQEAFGEHQVDLEAKFNLLVDILLKAAEERVREQREREQH